LTKDYGSRRLINQQTFGTARGKWNKYTHKLKLKGKSAFMPVEYMMETILSIDKGHYPHTSDLVTLID
jgi:hypothetical protein